VGCIIHLRGVVTAADNGKQRKQTSHQQHLCRQTIGAPRIAEPARATRPTATHQGTQPGSQAQVEETHGNRSNSRSNSGSNKNNSNNDV